MLLTRLSTRWCHCERCHRCDTADILQVINKSTYDESYQILGGRNPSASRLLRGLIFSVMHFEEFCAEPLMQVSWHQTWWSSPWDVTMIFKSFVCGSTWKHAAVFLVANSPATAPCFVATCRRPCFYRKLFVHRHHKPTKHSIQCRMEIGVPCN